MVECDSDNKSGNGGWYYIVDGKTVGPVDIAVISDIATHRGLRADTPVWHESFGSEWKAAGDVPEIVEVARKRMAERGYPFSRGSMRLVFAQSWRMLVDVLFSHFSVATWFILGLCVWLSSVRSVLGVTDNQVLIEGVRNHAADGFAVLVESCRKGLATLSSVNGIRGAVPLVLWSFLVCFIRAQGRLMLLQFASMPPGSRSVPWNTRRTRTWSLALMHFILDVAMAVVVGFGVAAVLRDLPENCGFDDFTALLRSSAAFRMVICKAVGMAACVGLLKSFLYNFVEPTMCQTDCNAFRAFGRALALFARHPFALCRYYAVLWALKATVSCIGAVAAGAAVLILMGVLPASSRLFALVLPVIAVIAAIPFVLFFRFTGMCIVASAFDDPAEKPEPSGTCKSAGKE